MMTRCLGTALGHNHVYYTQGEVTFRVFMPQHIGMNWQMRMATIITVVVDISTSKTGNRNYK